MKRSSWISAMLIASMAMTSACSSHKPPHIEITDTEPQVTGESAVIADPQLPEATIFDTEETEPTSPPAYTPIATLSPDEYPAGYVANSNIWVDVLVSQRDEETAVFYIPKLRADSEDAARINAEISDLTTSLIDNTSCKGADFIYFRNSDMVFSILINAYMDDGSTTFRSYTFDTTEGTEFTNTDILTFVELSEEGFYNYACGAVRKLLSSEDSAGEETFIEGELNPESELGSLTGSSDDALAAYYETFSESNINTEMDLFIDETGSICFCTNVIDKDTGALTTRAFTSSGRAVRTLPSSLVYGSSCMADINYDNLAEYITVNEDGSVTVYSIMNDTLTEIITLPTTRLSLATAYMYEESGYVGARVLRAELDNSESGRSYEIIVVSTQNEITYNKVISWNDINSDGIITEDDQFTIDGEVTGFAEWYDLTGIS